MNNENLKTSHLTIFIVLWSVSILSHQIYYGVVFNSPFDLLLSALAFISILIPGRFKIFILLLFIQVFTVFIYLPNVYNHWFLSMFVSSLMLFNYLVMAVSGRTLNINKENFFEKTAPALRTVLLVVYFMAFFHKLNSDYFSPEVSCGIFMYLKLSKIYGFLPKEEIVKNFFIYFSLFLELSIPLLLLSARTRMAGILTGLFTHLFFGIMGYLNFSIIMYSLLSLYLPLNFFNTGVEIDKYKFSAGLLKFLKKLIYIFLIITVSIFIYSRFIYISENKPLTKNLWAIVFSLLSLAVISIFIARLRLIKYRWPENFFRFSLLNGFLIFLFILNCFSPYLGFKTQNVLSMYSNLRTENQHSNHIIGDKLVIGNYQNDIAEIKDSNIKVLKKTVAVPYVQLENYIFGALWRGQSDIYIEYVKDANIVRYNVDRESYMKSRFIQKFISWKFFDFKPVSDAEKQVCGL